MHHDYDVLGRCKRCGAHKARFAEDEEPCESASDRLAAEVKRLSAALEASDRRVETREAEIKRLNEGMVAAGKRIHELEDLRIADDLAHVRETEALNAALAAADAAGVKYAQEVRELEAELGEMTSGANDGVSVNIQLRERIDAALAILRTPGTWSEFAAKAIKALEGK